MTGPIVAYGATGYTGRLIVEELAGSGADVALAGRRREGLEAVRADLGLDADVRVADADDPDALDPILDDAGAVVNTAGPFLAVGDGVARAAVRTGTPYVDSTGEQRFARELFDDLDSPARDAGVPLVPMLAFEYAPGDLVAALLLDGGGTDRLAVAYRIDHGVATAGTRKSILEVAARTGFQRVDGRLREEPPAEATRTFAIEGRELSAYSFPGGEVLTVPAHEEVDTVRTYMVAHPDTIARLKRFGGLARALLVGPVRALAHALVDLRHEDPTPDDRGRTGARVRLEADRDGTVETAEFTCRDPYAFTAACLAEGATRLADADEPAGVLAPAEAFEPERFLQAVEKRHPEMSWTTG